MGRYGLGTLGGGVSTYDGSSFVSFTTADGLAGNWIYDIHQVSEGAIWFGTSDGVSRYDLQPVLGTDGRRFVNLTVQEGLANNTVRTIHHDADGTMWFGTDGGVSQYNPTHHTDGGLFVHLTTQDGLINNTVRVLHRAPDGGDVVWHGWGCLFV